METPPQIPFQPPPKPYWTAAKIIALVLVALVAVSATGVGLYYGVRNTTVNPASSTCSNGATNPPSCNNNVCANGATNFPSCNSYPPCSNGATNPPNCNTFPSCTNGANNPPNCNQYPPCTNGANNPPQCNTYSTTVSLSCTPTDGYYSGNIGSHQGPYGGFCSATVTDTTIPTGTIGWSGDWTIQNAWSGTSCILSGTSSSTSQCGSELTPPAPVNGFQSPVTVYANYQGDNTHTSSSGYYTFTAPSSVTLTATAMYQPGCVGCSVTSVVIINSATHQTYTITSSTCPGYSNWCFSVSLPNLADYTVTVYYSGTYGSGACHSVGTNPNFYMDIYQFSSKAGGNFDCS